MRAFVGSMAVTFAAFALWPAVVIAAEGDAYCPEKIETEQSLSKPVEGFEASNREIPHWWDAVTFFDGPPEEMAALVYDSGIKSDQGSEVQVWKLDPQREYWLRCEYSATSVSLAMKLPSVSQCTVFFRRDEGTLRLSLACR